MERSVGGPGRPNRKLWTSSPAVSSRPPASAGDSADEPPAQAARAVALCQGRRRKIKRSHTQVFSSVQPPGTPTTARPQGTRTSHRVCCTNPPSSKFRRDPRTGQLVRRHRVFELHEDRAGSTPFRQQEPQPRPSWQPFDTSEHLAADPRPDQRSTRRQRQGKRSLVGLHQINGRGLQVVIQSLDRPEPEPRGNHGGQRLERARRGSKAQFGRLGCVRDQYEADRMACFARRRPFDFLRAGVRPARPRWAQIDARLGCHYHLHRHRLRIGQPDPRDLEHYRVIGFEPRPQREPDPEPEPHLVTNLLAEHEPGQEVTVGGEPELGSAHHLVPRRLPEPLQNGRRLHVDRVHRAEVHRALGLLLDVDRAALDLDPEAHARRENAGMDVDLERQDGRTAILPEPERGGGAREPVSGPGPIAGWLLQRRAETRRPCPCRCRARHARRPSHFGPSKRRSGRLPRSRRVAGREPGRRAARDRPTAGRSGGSRTRRPLAPGASAGWSGPANRWQ